MHDGGPLPASVEVTVDAQAEPPLLDPLALPRRLHERHGTRMLVIFDEFQDVLTAIDRVDAVIRSEIQHHGDAASYIFAGSHVGMMRELFADRRRGTGGHRPRYLCARRRRTTGCHRRRAAASRSATSSRGSSTACACTAPSAGISAIAS